MFEVKCKTCGKKFNVHPARFHSRINFYCSKKCESIGKVAKPNYKCIVCGKPIHVKPSKIKKSKWGITCSRECLKINKSRHTTGAGNHQYGLKGKLNASFKTDKTTILKILN